MPIDTSEDESVDQLDELESDEEYKTVVGKVTKIAFCEDLHPACKL